MANEFPTTMTFREVAESYGWYLGDREPMSDLPAPDREGNYSGRKVFNWIQNNARSYGLALSVGNVTYR
jgi:hypothetical protein